MDRIKVCYRGGYRVNVGYILDHALACPHFFHGDERKNGGGVEGKCDKVTQLGRLKGKRGEDTNGSVCHLDSSSSKHKI